MWDKLLECVKLVLLQRHESELGQDKIMKSQIPLHVNRKFCRSASSFSVWKRFMRGFGNSRLARESVQSQSLEKASYNNQVLVLSENDAQKFVDMMVNPPKPSSALIAMLKGGSV